MIPTCLTEFQFSSGLSSASEENSPFVLPPCVAAGHTAKAKGDIGITKNTIWEIIVQKNGPFPADIPVLDRRKSAESETRLTSEAANFVRHFGAHDGSADGKSALTSAQ